MLAFAAALHADLASFDSGSGGTATQTRMGVATGQVTVLASAGGAGAAGFLSVQGAAASLAAQMEGLARPGAVYVHRSTVDKWAAEGRRAPPATVRVEGDGRGPQRAAVYDCAAGAFVAAGGEEPAAGVGPGRLRRVWSAPS